MQIVCESTQCTDEAVQVLGYQCLVRIMSLYYEKMPEYMQQALYQVRIATLFIVLITLATVDSDGYETRRSKHRLASH